MIPGPDEEEVVFDFANPTAGQMMDFFASLPPDTRFRVVDADSGLIIDFFEIVVDCDNVAWLEPCSSAMMIDDRFGSNSNQGPT